MTRRMLAEERELRKFFSVAYPNEAAEIKRDFRKMLSALIHAVREDERMKWQNKESAWVRDPTVAIRRLK